MVDMCVCVLMGKYTMYHGLFGYYWRVALRFRLKKHMFILIKKDKCTAYTSFFKVTICFQLEVTFSALNKVTKMGPKRGHFEEGGKWKHVCVCV